MAAIDYHKLVEAAIRATVFHSPTAYSWFGQFSQRLAPRIQRTLTSQGARNYLLFTLKHQLYSDFYCQGAPISGTWLENGPRRIGLTPFVERLSAANSGQGYWESSWEVRSIEEGQIVVHRDGLTLQTLPEDCLTAADESIEPGRRLSLRFPKDFLAMSPGFYMALSDKAFSADDSSPNLVRFYWHLTPIAAEELVRYATLWLNQADLPYQLKVINDPERFNRCDAAVLYTRQSDYAVVSKIVSRIYSNVVAGLKPGTPALTKPLAPGLGLAEDPGRGESFGLHRCRLLADGLIRAYEQGKRSVDERMRIVEDRFAEDGILLERPFLNPGSSDKYDFRPPRLQSDVQSRSIVDPVSEGKIDTDLFLQTAHKIGHRLFQEAIWHGDRCTWLGADSDESDSASTLTGTTYKTLGAELYNGTSGVALFLAELYAATGDTEIGRTALGAIRQALSRADILPPPTHLGFYSGWTGIAFVAARLGSLLDEEELQERAHELLQRLTVELPNEHELDLLSGNAGAIVGLVNLKEILDDNTPLDLAVRLGNELLNTAEKSKAGYSWRTIAYPNYRNLTGFSHGTAGIGFALLELFQVTGEAKYRHAAEQAFDYERYWFDTEARNWPSFQLEAGPNKRRKRATTFVVHWCHGAPGIALSRLRAYHILNNETYRTEAIIALQITRKMVETWLRTGSGNYSLCHGLAGNAEVLLHGYHLLGEEWADDNALAYEVGQAGIEFYDRQGMKWPCGTTHGETPGLMLGLAGIGYFYLRLYNSTTPSILALNRVNFQLEIS